MQESKLGQQQQQCKRVWWVVKGSVYPAAKQYEAAKREIGS